MKKIVYIIITILLFLTSYNIIYADLVCTESAAKQMANIVCHEYGSDYTGDAKLDFYTRITTTAVVLNNAYIKNGSTWYEKMQNLTDNNYAQYSTYKNSDYNSSCSASTQIKAQMLYLAGLVMNGRYALPSNLRLQAAEYIVRPNGKVWDHIDLPGTDAMYFGSVEINDPLSTKDVFGRTLSDTTNTYYRQLASTLMQSDYTKYTSSNVCSLTKDSDDQPITYNINYDLVGGVWTSNASKPSNTKIGSIVTISNPKKTITVTGDANGTGATIGAPLTLTQEFAGWSSSSTNGLESKAVTGSTSSTLTSWNGTATLNKYFKNLRSSEGTIKLVATWKNITKELPTVTKQGYTCKWNTKSDGSGISYDSKGRYTFVGISSSGFTLYAECIDNQEEMPKENSEKENYMIVYNSEGSTNVPKSQIKEAGVSIILSKQIPKNDGYTFVVWNTKADGTGKSCEPGETYTADESVMLYAIWSKNKANSIDSPQTGVPLLIPPLIAILSVIYLSLYIKRMKENNTI